MAKLVVELGKIGYERWTSNAEAKEKLVAILQHLRLELERNYNGLQHAYDGSTDEQLERAVYESANEAIAVALRAHPDITEPLRRAYEQITPGFQARLRKPLQFGANQDELVQLWRLFGQASHEIDRWLKQQGAMPEKFSKEDCTPKTIGDCVGGWPPAEQVRILRRWRDFSDAFRQGKARIYTAQELGGVTMYGQPDRELEVRREADERYPAMHAFELADGIFEFWLEPSLRILFARDQYGLFLLDLVQLAGREQAGWTPKWYVERAACRNKNRLRP